jgi:hypothetical protein
MVEPGIERIGIPETDILLYGGFDVVDKLFIESE